MNIKSSIEEIKQQVEGKSLEERIKDLDKKLSEINLEVSLKGNKQFQSFLGIRLALEMVFEIQEKVSIGSYSSRLILEWSEKYGSSELEFVISTAKQFLTSPESLKKSLEEKLF